MGGNQIYENEIPIQPQENQRYEGADLPGNVGVRLVPPNSLDWEIPLTEIELLQIVLQGLTNV